jgi:hypothetical protein
MILVKDFIEHLIQANHERLMLLHCWLFEKLKALFSDLRNPNQRSL